MITKDNLKEVIATITTKDVKRINSSCKEYCVLKLHLFNTGHYTEILLTDNYDKYKNVSYNGNAILEVNEVQNLLKSLN